MSDGEIEGIVDSIVRSDSDWLFFDSQFFPRQVTTMDAPAAPVRIRKSRRVRSGMAKLPAPSSAQDLPERCRRGRRLEHSLQNELPIRHRAVASFPVRRFPELPRLRFCGFLVNINTQAGSGRYREGGSFQNGLNREKSFRIIYAGLPVIKVLGLGHAYFEPGKIGHRRAKVDR